MIKLIMTILLFVILTAWELPNLRRKKRRKKGMDYFSADVNRFSFKCFACIPCIYIEKL
ncbi:hypothetical protein GCM10020331_005740 [Ectobacillus funiculus]